MFALFAADSSAWLDLLGRAHPLILHAPLGVLPAIALLEFGAALFRRPLPRGAVLTLACFNAIAAVLAAVSGVLLARDGYEGDTVGTHKILGIALAALSVVAAVLAAFARRLPFRVVLLVALGVMVPAGHLGGTLTHGADFLFPKAKTKAPAPSPSPVATDGTPAAKPASEFERVIRPFLERTCTKCHNPDKKKGELLLIDAAGITKGGENGAVLVPGKPDESPLLTRCELPLDHDDHMPPPEKPQPTKEELAALRAWIANGAPF